MTRETEGYNPAQIAAIATLDYSQHQLNQGVGIYIDRVSIFRNRRVGIGEDISTPTNKP
jgi:hypothetical protein